MGQKVHPYSFRLGVNKTWKSKWFVSPAKYADTLHEDLRIRKYLLESPEGLMADINDIEIIRHPQRVRVVVDTVKPGVLIGNKGSNIERMTAELQKMTDQKVMLKIKEIKRPECQAQVIALNLARQLKNRAPFRRVLKMTMLNATKAGVQGIKIKISGRLGGADMARTQEVKTGRVPLHTLRADIDYGFAESMTTFGVIGVKVWIFNGELYNDKNEDAGQLVKKQESRSREGK